MRFNFLKDKDGNPIGLKAFENSVYDKKGRNLIDKINSINTKIQSIQDSLITINERIQPFLPPPGPFDGVTLKQDSNSNICLLTDNKGVVTSDYG